MKVSKLETYVGSSDKESKEPAITVGTIVTFVTALAVSALNAFFPGISDEVKQTVISTLAIVIPFVVAWIIRKKVWSPSSVGDIIEEVKAEQTEPPKAPRSLRLDNRDI